MVFKGLTFLLDFDRTIKFKEKVVLKNKIIQYHGIVSYSLNKNVTYIVSNNPESTSDSYRGQCAKKLGIPIVKLQYLQDCLDHEKTLDISDYVVLTDADKFKSGCINLPRFFEHSVEPEEIPDFESLVKNAEYDIEFDEQDFVCAKFSVTAGTELWVNNNKNRVMFVVIKWVDHTEEQASKFPLLQVRNIWRFTSFKDALAFYCYITPRPEQGDSPTFNIHMKVFKDMHISDEASKLLNFYWNVDLDRATLELSKEDIFRGISLLQDMGYLMKRLGDNPDDIKLVAALREEIKELRDSLPRPLRGCSQYPCKTLSQVCRSISDLEVILERFSLSSDIGLPGMNPYLYSSLNCHISCVKEPPLIGRVLGIDNAILATLDHVTSRTLFNRGDHPEQCVTLYHVARRDNVISILSRGLLLPSQIYNDLGVIRRDWGNLGNGIYFSSRLKDCRQYINYEDNTIFKCNVYVGKVLEVLDYQEGALRAPAGFDSFRGVPQSENPHSCFGTPEYCIFDERAVQILQMITCHETLSDLEGPDSPDVNLWDEEVKF